MRHSPLVYASLVALAAMAMTIPEANAHGKPNHLKPRQYEEIKVNDPGALDIVAVDVPLPGVGVTVTPTTSKRALQTHTYDKGGFGVRGLKTGEYVVTVEPASLIAAIDAVAPGEPNGRLRAYVYLNNAAAPVSFDLPYCRSCADQGMSIGLSIPKGSTAGHPANARMWLTFEAVHRVVAAEQPAAAPQGSLPPGPSAGIGAVGISPPVIEVSAFALAAGIFLLVGNRSHSNNSTTRTH